MQEWWNKIKKYNTYRYKEHEERNCEYYNKRKAERIKEFNMQKNAYSIK